MKNHLKLFALILILILSCKSTQNSKDLKLSDVDLVLSAFVEREMRELGNKFAITETSIGSCDIDSIDYTQFLPIGEDIIWNKTIFPSLTYINNETLLNSKSKGDQAYIEFLSVYGKNGWFQLSKPSFSKDKEYALIKFIYGKFMPYTSGHYLLKRKKNSKEFKIIRLVDGKLL